MVDQQSDNNSVLRDGLLREKELALKEREIALKEREVEHKLALEKRKVWLTSPLLIAIVSALFGAVLTAVLQGYSNSQLERQKFEFSLIQKSLEIEDKLIEDQSDREESAKKLLFLVKSGIIQSLDSNSIEKLANNPKELPTFSNASVQFFCGIIGGESATFVRSSKFGMLPLIVWNSGFFESGGLSDEERCIRASNNFQEAYERGILIYFSVSIKDRQPVVCAVTKIDNDCDIKLFTLKPGSNGHEVIKKLHDLRTGGTSQILYE